MEKNIILYLVYGLGIFLLLHGYIVIAKGIKQKTRD